MGDMHVTCKSHETHAGHMQVTWETCMSHASHMGGTCKSHVGHMGDTCKSHGRHAGHIERTAHSLLAVSRVTEGTHLPVSRP